MFNETIRKLESRDIVEVEKIFDLYWSGDFRHHLSERLKTGIQGLKWFVAAENGEVVGVVASREAPERMKQYTKTDKVIEFYVVAAKYQGKGIGTALRNLQVDEAKKEGYQEAVFFSGVTHQDSWGFHDNSEFRRVGVAIAPDGEKGQIWLMDLK